MRARLGFASAQGGVSGGCSVVCVRVILGTSRIR